MIKITQPTTFKEGFEEFIWSRETEGCRPATIKHYRDSIHVFTLYFDENMRMDDIVSSTVSNFFSHLQNRGLAEKTICTYIRALRTVLYYFMEQGWTFDAQFFRCVYFPRLIIGKEGGKYEKL